MISIIEIETYVKIVLHIISFLIGIVGILVLLFGLIDSLGIYLKNKRRFQKIRYVMGKHILLGLDFLVVKDIIETVFLNGKDVQIMDIVLLIVIVSIRVVLTTHTQKGVQEMHEELEREKGKIKIIDKELCEIESEEEKLEDEISQLKEADILSEKKRKELEEKILAIAKQLHEKKQEAKRKN